MAFKKIKDSEDLKVTVEFSQVHGMYILYLKYVNTYLYNSNFLFLLLIFFSANELNFLDLYI